MLGDRLEDDAVASGTRCRMRRLRSGKAIQGSSVDLLAKTRRGNECSPVRGQSLHSSDIRREHQTDFSSPSICWGLGRSRGRFFNELWLHALLTSSTCDACSSCTAELVRFRPWGPGIRQMTRTVVKRIKTIAKQSPVDSIGWNASGRSPKYLDDNGKQRSNERKLLFTDGRWQIDGAREKT